MRHIRSGINYLIVLILVLLGFVGLALPIVPQAIFFLLAFIILTFEIPKLGDWVESKMDKEGKVWKLYHTHRQKFEKYFK